MLRRVLKFALRTRHVSADLLTFSLLFTITSTAKHVLIHARSPRKSLQLVNA